MKKTVNVHLGKQLFVLEEDAYTRLDNYLNNLQNSFQDEIGTEEIMEDFELRFAELFQEKMKASQVIDLETVEYAISQLGETETIANQSGTNQTKKTSTSQENKRFFRNEKDVVIGGIASGLAKSFNLDPIVFRLIFGVGTLFFGSALFIYLVLLAIVPFESKPKPNRLEKDSNSSTFKGVCGGIANYLQVEKHWIQLLFVVFAITIFPIILYIILSIVLPEKGSALK